MSEKLFFKMPIIKNKILEILKKKNLSQLKLACIINYDDAGLNAMILGKRPFPEIIKEKLLPILEVSKEEFESWIIADKYDKEIIKKAIESAKWIASSHPTDVPCNDDKNKPLILTQNIDRILKEKKLSRTALSKIIKHSQSSLNCAIIGKEPLSKNVMKKLSTTLEIPEKDLQAWVLADKYPLSILELALKVGHF